MIEFSKISDFKISIADIKNQENIKLKTIIS